ncbi:hypothetical protein MXB_556 [Myxobolus squamalis]|nr:hypothetical protein MXB_556 [Myxobolus squamalis]
MCFKGIGSWGKSYAY